ncbi:MAG: hypothetical protein WD690_10130 [Vicinamibacterales bacterium]
MGNSSRDAWSDWTAQIERHYLERGLLPTPTQEGLSPPVDVVSEFWLELSTERSRLAPLCVLGEAAGAAPQRAAVLLLLYYLTTERPYLRLSDEDEEARREVVRELFAEAVNALDIASLDHAWRIRWELLFAAGAGSWRQVQQLTARWSQVCPNEEFDAQKALARIYLLSVHPLDKEEEPLLDYWLPYEGSAWARTGDLFVLASALHLDARDKPTSADWTLPHSITAEEFARVVDIDNALTKATERCDGVDVMWEAIGAWASGAIGVRLSRPERVLEAARRYDRLSEIASFLGDATDDKGNARWLAARSAAVLYKHLRRWDDVRRMTVTWCDLQMHLHDDGVEETGLAEAWKFRAEAERELGLTDMAESFAKYVQFSAETDNNWEHTELIRLLYESRDELVRNRGLHMLALEHPERSSVAQLLNWDWSAFSRMCPRAQARWWEGLLFVCDERVRTAFGRPPWRYAGECFGEAVALELKERIFIPFVATPICTSDLPDRERRLANALTRAKIPLGMLIDLLELTQNPNSRLGRQVSDHLGKAHLPLFAVARSRTELAKAREIVDIRNLAAHDDIREAETRKIYVGAKKFLDLLTASGARGA